jgi:hypothetical protein
MGSYSKSSDHNVEKRDFRMIDSCRTQTIMKFHILVLIFQYRAYERGVQSEYIGQRPWEPWISEGPHSLNHRCFILIVLFFIFWGYFQLFLVYFYKYVIWTFCCTGNKSIIKVYQWFYWTSNSQFCIDLFPVQQNVQITYL